MLGGLNVYSTVANFIQCICAKIFFKFWNCNFLERVRCRKFCEFLSVYAQILHISVHKFSMQLWHYNWRVYVFVCGRYFCTVELSSPLPFFSFFSSFTKYFGLFQVKCCALIPVVYFTTLCHSDWSANLMFLCRLIDWSIYSH